MGLLGNGFRHNLVGRITTATTNLDGCNASTIPASYNLTAFRRNMLVGSAGFGSTTSVPDGCRHPVAWLMPQKAGGLSTRNSIIGSGGATGTGQSGYNLDVLMQGEGGIPSLDVALIVQIAVTMAGSGGISSALLDAITNLSCTLAGSGGITANAAGLADLAVLLEGAGGINPDNTALMDLAVTMRGYGDLTPEGIRDTVWNALLAQFQGDGTAGKALSTASSGGVDLDALAAAVWAYATRSLPAAERDAMAAAILAAAQATPIHSNVKEVNDLTVDGTGTELDPWGPV